jgi:hypothetical protein
MSTTPRRLSLHPDPLRHPEARLPKPRKPGRLLPPPRRDRCADRESEPLKSPATYRSRSISRSADAEINDLQRAAVSFIVLDLHVPGSLSPGMSWIRRKEPRQFLASGIQLRPRGPTEGGDEREHADQLKCATVSEPRILAADRTNEWPRTRYGSRANSRNSCEVKPGRKETNVMKVRTKLKAGANPFTDPDG